MPDLLAKGALWLAQQRTKHAAARVMYAAGMSTVQVPATPGRTTFDVEQGDGTVLQTESRDFLIKADLLKLDGITVEPVAGARITDLDGVIFEVMAFGSEPPWRWADGYRYEYRIHTKQIGRAAT